MIAENYTRNANIFLKKAFCFKTDEISEMAENVTGRNKIYEELEQ